LIKRRVVDLYNGKRQLKVGEINGCSVDDGNEAGDKAGRIGAVV
jgi:hypothetical protein